MAGAGGNTNRLESNGTCEGIRILFIFGIKTEIAQLVSHSGLREKIKVVITYSLMGEPYKVNRN